MMSNEVIWKQINSAPRDGAKVLLYAKCKTIPDDKPGPVVGYWEKSVMQWKIAADFVNQADELMATHWMEIPKPPTTS